MSELIPYVRETFRRHLNQAEAVLLVDFDKLKRVSDMQFFLLYICFRILLSFLTLFLGYSYSLWVDWCGARIPRFSPRYVFPLSPEVQDFPRASCD